MTNEELINHIKYDLEIGADITLTNEDAVKIIKALEQQPCEDCREEVCDYIAEFVNHEYATDRERELVKNIIGGIQHLPSIRSKTELENWEGIHAQVTAPKGTFDKIWNEAEDNDEI